MAVVGTSAAAGAAPRVLPLAQARRSQTPTTVHADARLEALAKRLRRARAGAVDGARRRVASDVAGGAQRALAQLHHRLGGALTLRLRPGVGTPMQIGGGVLQAATGDTAATGRAFLRSNRALLRLDEPDQELALLREEQDHLGRRHLRYTQFYQGLPVWPAELIVHLDRGGNVDLVDGAYVPTPRQVALKPVLGADAAVWHARAAVAGAAGARAGAAGLIIYAAGRRARLAWRFELTASLSARWLVVIDAVDGSLLAALSQVQDSNVHGSGEGVFGDTLPLEVWREGSTFYLADTSKPMFDPSSRPPQPETTRGAIIVLDAQNQPPSDEPEEFPDLFHVTSDSATSWSVPDGVSAAFGLAQVYDYYRERHGRNSIDGAGGSILAVVRLGRDFNNAFWNGALMAFGDAQPYAGTLDVVGHELTHGVTEYTAGLVYQDQPGALNEAFSDIFGEAVETRTVGAPDWIVGGQLPDPLRSMADPARFGDPATMSEYYVTERDHGGVHTNSGIINHAFYQLAEGLSGALGMADAERIFYRALALHLVANSRFVDARLACIAAAKDLFGNDSRQARKTAEAFDAVEIYDGRGTPLPAPFPPVAGVDATLFLFYDGNAESYFLGRREEALGDPSAGVQLLEPRLAPARPSVSGDGSFAVFVNSENDVCFVNTDGSFVDPEAGTPERCLGFPGLVSSVAVAPDGNRFGFVLLDNEGEPENLIRVIDTAAGSTRTFTLRAPTHDGGAIDSVRYAGAMDFSADGRLLIYDALNEMRVSGGAAVSAWSIYALDLSDETTLAIVPPVPGMDVAYPALSQTSDDFITFDAYDQEREQSTVMAGSLTTGDFSEIAVVRGGYGAPGYSGDDGAIVYSQASDTATEFSLMRQPLASDHRTPLGSPVVWVENADYGVIYRRGSFVGPSRCIGDCSGDGEVTVDELVKGVNIALGLAPLGDCPWLDTNADGEVTVDELVAAVNAALGGCA
ncbi:MAG: M4 family metallopeptidase [Deltaproteobacteria bacterium]|nr:M4 family metallopeptidase [Deltaproteobacteria bacterium]